MVNLMVGVVLACQRIHFFHLADAGFRVKLFTVSTGEKTPPKFGKNLGMVLEKKKY